MVRVSLRWRTTVLPIAVLPKLYLPKSNTNADGRAMFVLCTYDRFVRSADRSALLVDSSPQQSVDHATIDQSRMPRPLLPLDSYDWLLFKHLCLYEYLKAILPAYVCLFGSFNKPANPKPISCIVLHAPLACNTIQLIGFDLPTAQMVGVQEQSTAAQSAANITKSNPR